MPKFCFTTTSKPNLFLKSTIIHLVSVPLDHFQCPFIHTLKYMGLFADLIYLNLTIFYALFCHLPLFLNNMSWGSFRNFKCWRRCRKREISTLPIGV